MKALVYTGMNSSELRDVEAPVALGGQSIVDLSFCGICGSDMHAWHGHDERRIPPLVLGHEAVGTALTGPLAGQRVAINPLMTCNDCPACDSGNHHLCGTRELIGMRYPGAFAEQVMVPDANLTALADHLSFSVAALAEPAAVAVRAVEIAAGTGATADSRIVILGGGAIGVLVAQVLAARSFARPRIAETNALRRGMLDNISIAGSYDPRKETPEDGSVDLVIDCVGMGVTRTAASAMARPGGVIVHVRPAGQRAGPRHPPPEASRDRVLRSLLLPASGFSDCARPFDRRQGDRKRLDRDSSAGRWRAGLHRY